MDKNANAVNMSGPPWKRPEGKIQAKEKGGTMIEEKERDL